jgi:outer membrane PBP1 activator LpoA protein
MFIKKIKTVFCLCSALCAVCSCTGTKPVQIGDAADLSAPTAETGGRKNIAVILPDSKLGNAVKTSVLMAFAQRRADDINVKFADLSGDRESRAAQIDSVLDSGPDLIIGPVFAEDADALRGLKPSATPVLSFTSDATALGGGIMTMSLMPGQSVEAMIRRMAAEGRKKAVVLAPDGASGYIMGNVALDAARIYDLGVAGFYYYAAGNMDSMKQAAENAAIFKARGNANTRAKEILSDILLNQTLSAADRASVAAQLEERNKSDTIGDAPFDSVLFLGNAADSKALGSFLRYFDAPAGKVKFYGTAMWDNEAMFRDMTMAGASYAAMPAVSPEFAAAYREIADAEPERISPMGYDAAMLAIRALRSDRGAEAYLIDPSGFKGLDGLIRLRPDGKSERALQIMTLDASGVPKIAVSGASNFIKPLYQLSSQNSAKHDEIRISEGVNPLDYIRLPAELHGKYSAKTYKQSGGASPQPPVIPGPEVVILPEDSSDPVLADPDFQPVELEPVSRTLVDEVEIRN